MHRFLKKKEERYPGYNTAHSFEPQFIRLNEGISQYQWYFFESETLFEGNNKGLEPLGHFWEYFHLSKDDRELVISTIRQNRAREIQMELERISIESASNNLPADDDIRQYVENLLIHDSVFIEESVSKTIDAKYYKVDDIKLLLEYLLCMGAITSEQWTVLYLYAAKDDNAYQAVCSLFGAAISISSLIPTPLSIVSSLVLDFLSSSKSGSANDYLMFKNHFLEVLDDIFHVDDDALLYGSTYPSSSEFHSIIM